MLKRTTDTTPLAIQHMKAAYKPLSATVITKNDVPILMINRKAVAPISFFYNIQQSTNYIERFQNPQVSFSKQAGVHIYSTLIPTSYVLNGKDTTGLNEILESFISKDPEALLILRIWPGPKPGWPEWGDIPTEESMLYADGIRGPISIASDYYWKLSNRGLSELIRYIEDGPYSDHILGYHVGGPEFEMFPYQYREQGPDISRPNQIKFRQWLRSKYKSDRKLQQAWGDNTVTLSTAKVPVGEPGRFPMHSAGYDKTISVFYDLPKERNWVDFGEFTSDTALARIQDWASLIKRETQLRKLTIFCYGYFFDLSGSFGAHSALQKMLKSPNVDILMSPITYLGRAVGEPGSFMSPVDSIALHKKLWLNEDDIRTAMLDPSALPSWIAEDMLTARNQTTQTTVNLLDRNFGNLLIHRAATWWTDLSGAGALNDPAPWAMLAKRLPMYQRLYEHPTPYRPEVALILDETSKLYVKSDIDAWFWSLMDFRNQCGKSGAAVGYYTLQDFISGLVPRCKAYLFPNSFHITDAQATQINARLDRERATALWHYAAGCIGSDGLNTQQASTLTGIQTAQHDGRQTSSGEGLLAGLKWAPDFSLSPRMVVSDPKANILGRYADGEISSAAKMMGHHTSIFMGSMGISAEVLTRLFSKYGVHTWTRDGSVIQTDGQWLMVHSGIAGHKTIYLPKGVRAEPLAGTIIKRSGQELTVEFSTGETRWFKLS
ncbi:MAG: hypothetical protein ACYC1M_07440 [Armatimonadota bacterium]